MRFLLFLVVVGAVGYLFYTKTISLPFKIEIISAEANKQGPDGNEQNSELRASQDKVFSYLKKISSVTSMGVSFTNYSEVLIQTKPEIDLLLEGISSGSFRGDVEKILQIYIDAKTLWQTTFERGDGYVSITLEQKMILTDRYPRLAEFGNNTWKAEVVSLLWEMASDQTRILQSTVNMMRMQDDMKSTKN